MEETVGNCKKRKKNQRKIEEHAYYTLYLGLAYNLTQKLNAITSAIDERGQIINTISVHVEKNKQVNILVIVANYCWLRFRLVYVIMPFLS